MATKRLKRSEITQIVLRNGKDDNGEWIDLNISVGSWVTAMPSQRGDHKVKKSKLNDLTAHYKVQVVGFVFGQGGRSVDEIDVVHGYAPPDMMREDIAKSPMFPKLEVNCLCSSDFKDRVPAQSITSVLEVHHHAIGHLLFPDVSLSSLRDQGVWFLKFHYTKTKSNVGKLAMINSPALSQISKGVNDRHLLTAFRCLLAREVGRLLTEIGGVRGGAKAFIPISIFASMFKDVQTLKVAPQTYTFQGVSESSLEQIFYGEWRRRIHETGGQETVCEVDSSFTFRYRLPKQTLYCNFFVQRRKKQKENSKWCWKAVEEHCVRAPSIELVVHMGNSQTQTLNVEKGWTLLETRRLLESLTGVSEFHFIMDSKKVGYRRECTITCEDCMPPHILGIERTV